MIRQAGKVEETSSRRRRRRRKKKEEEDREQNIQTVNVMEHVGGRLFLTTSLYSPVTGHHVYDDVYTVYDNENSGEHSYAINMKSAA